MLTIIIQFSQMESYGLFLLRRHDVSSNTIITTQRWSIIKPSTSNNHTFALAEDIPIILINDISKHEHGQIPALHSTTIRE